MGVVLLAVAELIPTSVVGTQRSQDVEVATAYAAYLLDDARLHPQTLINSNGNPPLPLADLIQDVTLGNTLFHVVRHQSQLMQNGTLIDVTVTITGQRPPNIVLGTRILVNPNAQ